METWIQLVISILTLLGIIFAIYKFFRDPDIKAEKKISLLEKGCNLRHEYLNKDISNIYKDLSFIKDNHLLHIEEDISKLKGDVVKILTILEERSSLQNKIRMNK